MRLRLLTKGFLEAHGYGDLQGRLNLLSKEGKWGEMTSLIDDELLNTVAVVAETPEEVAARDKEKIFRSRGQNYSSFLFRRRRASFQSNQCLKRLS